MYCTLTATVHQMFSQLNTPFFEVAPDLGDLLVQDSEPAPLLRQTNEWQGYFGKYPEFCARITTEPQIQMMLNSHRHVARIPINTANTAIAQRETMDKVESIVTQLERFHSTWRKLPGKIELTPRPVPRPVPGVPQVPGVVKPPPIYNDQLSLEFFVCNDSGNFHVLASRPAMFTDGEIFNPDMEDEKLNQLIFCIRLIFMDRDPADELPILTHNLWEMAVHTTLTPDFHRVEFYPEWMDDDIPDWFLAGDFELSEAFNPPFDPPSEPFDERFLFYA